jgi:hypothetical protein
MLLELRFLIQLRVTRYAGKNSIQDPQVMT